MLSLFSSLLSSLASCIATPGHQWDNTRDVEIVAACIAGDKQAWDDFVDSNGKAIYNAIHKTLRQRSFEYDNDTVDDIFQSIFVSLCDNNFKKLKSYQGNSRLTTWLHTVSVNATKDHLKSAQVSKSSKNESLDAPITDNLKLEDTISDDRPQSLDIIEKKEAAAAFQQAKEELNAREQLFMKLHYNKDLSLKEIAELFNTNQNNIYQLKNRIVKKLRHLIEIIYKNDTYTSSNNILST